MTYIENVFVCMAAPLVVALLSLKRGQRAALVFCLPQFTLYVTRGDLLLNVLMCGLTMMLAWCAVRGLVWAKKTGNGRLRRFYGTVLAFALGVCVTVLCVRLRGHEEDSADEERYDD